MSAVPPTPAGWGGGTFTEFLDASRQNVFAGFANTHPVFQRFSEIDRTYRTVIENLKNPPDWFVAMFILRTHSSFLGAAHLALAGQLPEAYMLMRGCLENAIYGFYFHLEPASHERWLRRHDSDDARKIVRREFEIARMIKRLHERDEPLGTVVKVLYERTIDNGAHPNERGLLQMVRIGKPEQPKEHRIEIRYLTANNSASMVCLKSTAQVGVSGLKVFRHFLPERYEFLGVNENIDALQRDL
jgi:hypothetical protein